MPSHPSKDMTQGTTWAGEQTVAKRFNTLNRQRDGVLVRGRASSQLTIPAILPQDGHTEEDVLDTPFQGLGARGVNNLAAKLLLTLLPPQTPFFNLEVDETTKQELLASGLATQSQLEAGLQRFEQVVLAEIEAEAMRVPSYAAFRSLITTGNALIHVPDKSPMKSFRLDQYVVNRDGEGNLTEICVREIVSRETLTEEELGLAPKEQRHEGGDRPGGKGIQVFTKIFREGNKMKAFQEINGVVVPDSEGSWPIEESPWIALRWTAMPGELYGRGHVEELFGDLNSLEGLMRAMIKGTAAASKVVFAVNPAGTTRPEHLAKANTGDIIRGNAEDVSVIAVDKFQDFQVTMQLINVIEARLNQQFLLNTSVTRDAERVTAEEIRFMARELEDALGGVFSLLSQEFQRPFLNRLIARLRKAGKLPAFPKDTIKPKIVTGLDALGRGQNLDKLNVFLGVTANIPNRDAYLSPGEALRRIANSIGIDTQGLILTDEEVAQAQQNAALTQAGVNMAPGVAREATKGVVKQRLVDNQQDT